MIKLHDIYFLLLQRINLRDYIMVAQFSEYLEAISKF
jgi:hypothetical protein